MKKRMTKIITAVLACVMVAAVFAACGGNKTGNNGDLSDVLKFDAPKKSLTNGATTSFGSDTTATATPHSTGFVTLYRSQGTSDNEYAFYHENSGYASGYEFSKVAPLNKNYTEVEITSGTKTTYGVRDKSGKTVIGTNLVDSKSQKDDGAKVVQYGDIIYSYANDGFRKIFEGSSINAVDVGDIIAVTENYFILMQSLTRLAVYKIATGERVYIYEPMKPATAAANFPVMAYGDGFILEQYETILPDDAKTYTYSKLNDDDAVQKLQVDTYVIDFEKGERKSIKVDYVLSGSGSSAYNNNKISDKYNDCMVASGSFIVDRMLDTSSENVYSFLIGKDGKIKAQTLTRDNIINSAIKLNDNTYMYTDGSGYHIIADKDAKVIATLSNTLDYVSQLGSGIVFSDANGKYGVVNAEGNIKVKFEYTKIVSDGANAFAEKKIELIGSTTDNYEFYRIDSSFTANRINVEHNNITYSNQYLSCGIYVVSSGTSSMSYTVYSFNGTQLAFGTTPVGTPIRCGDKVMLKFNNTTGASPSIGAWYVLS